MAGNTFVAGETLTYVTDQKRQPIFVLLSSLLNPSSSRFHVLGDARSNETF